MQKKRFKLRRGEQLNCLHPALGDAGTFEVLRPLAEGGFGQVHLARRPRGDEWEFAVLKSPRWASEQLEVPLLLEERFAAEFDHPNTITFFGGCRTLKARPGPVLAFERAFPHPLLILNKPAVREGLSNDPGNRYFPLPPDVALDLGMDVLRGLVHIHERGFVHHDVKLANLLVVSDEPITDELLEDRELLSLVAGGNLRCVLADLGSCRSMAYLEDLNSGEVRATLQQLMPPQLTPIYAPPEAFLELEVEGEKRRQIFPSLDVYAAAMVLYATLTGRVPYDHLEMDPSDFTELEDLKYSELRGSLTPFAAEAVTTIPFHDVDFLGSGRTFADDLLGFLRACVDPSPRRRPTAQAAQRRFAELFGFHEVDGRLRQGVFRPRPLLSRLLEPWRGSAAEETRRLARKDKSGRLALTAALDEAKRLLMREARGISAEEVGLALRHVGIAAAVGVAFDPITFLLRRDVIRLPVARRLRPRLKNAGLPLPPLAPRVDEEQESAVFEVLVEQGELTAAALEEAEAMSQRLRGRSVPISPLEVLIATGALAPGPLDWALGLLRRREEQDEAPRTNSFTVRGALQPEERRGTGRLIERKSPRPPEPSKAEPEPALGVRLTRASLPVSDVRATEAFYRLLGLRRKAAARDGSKLLLADGEGLELELLRHPGAVPPLNIRIRSTEALLEQVFEQMCAAGFEPAEATDGAFTFLDPNGHRVRLES